MVNQAKRIMDCSITLMFELAMFLTVCYPNFFEKNKAFPQIFVVFQNCRKTNKSSKGSDDDDCDHPKIFKEMIKTFRDMMISRIH
jgi:hypothetical protein